MRVLRRGAVEGHVLPQHEADLAIMINCSRDFERDAVKKSDGDMVVVEFLE